MWTSAVEVGEVGKGGRRDIRGWIPELAKIGVRDVAEWRELL